MYELQAPLLSQKSYSTSSASLKFDIKSLQSSISHLQDPLFTSITTPSFVTSVSATSDGANLIYGTDDGTLYILSLLSNTLTPLSGHTAHINTLKLTSDNSYIVSLSDDMTIRIWSIEDSSELAVLEGHTEIPTQLALTFNNNIYILSAGEDNTVRLWDFEGRKELAVFMHYDHVLCLSAFYDGFYAVSGSKDGTVRVWNLEERKEEAVLRGHSDWVWSVAVSRNGEFIISGSEDRSIIVWNLIDRKIQYKLEGHTAEVNCLQMIWEDRAFISGSGNGKIMMWSMEDGKNLGEFEGHSAAISCLVIDSLSQFLVSGAYDNTVRIWNLNDKKSELVISSHTDVITCAALTASDYYLCTGSEDSTLKLWKFKYTQSEKTLLGHEGSVSCLAVSDNFEYIYSGGFDNIIRKWRASDGSELGIFSGHNDCIMSLLLLNSNTLVSAARESTIRVWDTEQEKTIQTLEEHSGSVNWLAGDEEGKLIASASEDCSICIWRSDTWILRGKLQGHSKSVNIVKINKSLLISASSDKTIILWNLPSMIQISTLSGHNDYIKTIAISYDGRFVASGSADKTIRVWSTITRDIIGVLEGHTGEVNKVEISNDSKFIVSGGNDKTVRIWSLRDLQQEAVLYGNFDVIYELALTYDSKYLISAFHDGSLRIYNIPENRQEAVLSGHTDGIKSLLISQDGRYILSGSDDKSIKLWDTTSYFHNCSIAQTCPSPALYGTQYLFRSARFVDAIISGFASSSPEVWMNDMMIVPYKLNVLHVLCYYNIPDKLRSALNDGCPIVINANGETPLSIALNRRSQNCIDVLLEYVIELSSQDMQRMRAVVQVLSQDMCSLMRRGSPVLGNFLDVVFVASEPSFEVPKYSLPQYYLTDSRFIQKENVVIKLDNTNTLSTQENEEVLVEFKTSSFSWNFESGSYESLKFLTSIQECSYRNILTSDFISSLIEMKWNRIWIYVLIQSLLYWLNLAILTYLLLNSSSFLALISFLILNSFFLGYEIFQVICMKSEYFKDGWNYLDIVRLVAGFSWAILGHYNISYMLLSWVITLIFWIRGLTYFRTFRYTRFFVRMILECVKDSLSFMIILLYSTMAVASLYVVSSPGLNSMADAFELSYQINMGEFSNDNNNLFQWVCFFSATILNCIVMLNLLISILGDSFEKSQMMAREADILEMLDLVIELEYLMIWKRNQGRKQHLQRCNYSEQSQLIPIWEGRIKAIEKKLMNISNEFNDAILNLQTTLLQALEAQSKLTNSNLLKHLQTSQQNFHNEMLQTLTSKLSSLSSSRASRSNLIT